MYLEKPLRDHNLLQAIARTNRPLPSMKKRTGIVVDYFGVFADLEKALNFDESVREESLIDWDRLRDTVPAEAARCMETFKGIAIEDTRECLLSALRRLREPQTSKTFEQNFRSLERLWEAVSPDPCLYPHRLSTTGCAASSLLTADGSAEAGIPLRALSSKTKELIQEHTTFVEMAQSLPVLNINQDYAGRLDELPTAADKAAAIEAMLTAELSVDDPSFVYRLLGERLQKIKEQQEADNQATAKRLRELEKIAGETAAVRQEPERLDLTRPGEYGLFTILRAHASVDDEIYIADCSRRMVGHLHDHQLSVTGWSNSTPATTQC